MEDWYNFFRSVTFPFGFLPYYVITKITILKPLLHRYNVASYFHDRCSDGCSILYFYQFKPLLLGNAMLLPLIRITSFPPYSKFKEKVSRTVTLWNILPRGCFLTIITSSSQGLIIIYSPYPRNIHLLLPALSFISHIMIILSVSFYLEWLSMREL